MGADRQTGASSITSSHSNAAAKLWPRLLNGGNSLPQPVLKEGEVIKALV